MAFKKKFVSPLTEGQKAALGELQGESYTARIGKRAQAILLSARGYSVDEISAIAECNRITVSHWLTNWEERGIDGLLEREGRGRKRYLTEDEENQAIKWLEDAPHNARNLAIRIDEVFCKKVSLDTVRRLLKRHGKVWKRVRSRPAGTPDPEEYSQCEQELAEYAVAAVEGEIDLFYFDESGFGREPCIAYAWQDLGADALGIPCRSGNRINVMGALSLMAGTVQAEMTDKSIKSVDVVGFLDRLSERLEKFSVAVMDNASIHTSEEVGKKLAEWEDKGLYIYYLPTYSPELDLMEIIWRLVKYKWLPLNAYASFKTLWENVKDVLSSIGSKHILYLA